MSEYLKFDILLKISPPEPYWKSSGEKIAETLEFIEAKISKYYNYDSVTF